MIKNKIIEYKKHFDIKKFNNELKKFNIELLLSDMVKKTYTIFY